MNKTKILIFGVLISLLSCEVFASNKSAYLHFLNGLILERKGNYSGALNEYRKTIVLDSEALFAYKQAVNIAIILNKFEEAAGWADYIVKVDSAVSSNWVMYGNVQWARGKIEPAKEAFKKAVEMDEFNSDGLYQLAVINSANNYKASLDYFEKYLKLRPENSPEVYFKMAGIYNSKGQLDEMQKYLEMSIKADSRYIMARYMLAEYYETKKDTAAAIEQYNAILDINASNAELFNYVGELYSGSRDMANAEKYFLKAYAIDNSNASACFWLAIINEQKKDFKAAIKYLKTSSQIDKDPSLSLRLSFYYTQSGGYDEAISLLEKANKKWPEDIEIAYFLALGYDDTHKTEKALEIFSEIVKKKPDNMEARMQYAVIAEKAGDIETAEENFRAILKKEPKNDVVLNYLGYALADRSLKLDEAEKVILKANEYSPSNAAYMDSLGWVHFKQGKTKQALKEIRAAITLMDKDAIVWDHLGDIYLALNDYEKAWYSFMVSSFIKPASKELFAKISEAKKKISEKDFARLAADFFGKYTFRLNEYSSFAKFKIKVGSKKIKLDGIIHYKAPLDLKITLISPLMTPVWNMTMSTGPIKMDGLFIEGIKEEDFSYWAKKFGTGILDYFTGQIFYIGEDETSERWSGSCLYNESYKICMDKEMNFVEKIQWKDGKKLGIEFKDYSAKGNFHLPGRFILRAPFSRVDIEPDNPKIVGQKTFFFLP